MSYLRRNNREAVFKSLIEKHKELAYNIAFKITKNEQDSEEIVQDSFVKAFGSLGSFKKQSRFSTWFYRIVYNTAISSMRSKKHVDVVINDYQVRNSYYEQIEYTFKNIDEQDRKRLTSEALANLNEFDYTILSLYYYEDMSLKEISGIVNKKKEYLKVLLQRARLKLYNALSASLKKELKELI